VKVFGIVVWDCDAVDDKLCFCRWKHWDKRMMGKVQVMIEFFGFMVSDYVHLSVEREIGILGMVILVSFNVFDGWLKYSCLEVIS
jgi:hypothetical protein